MAPTLFYRCSIVKQPEHFRRADGAAALPPTTTVSTGPLMAPSL